MDPIYFSWTWPLFLGGLVSLGLAYLGWRRISAPGAAGFVCLMLALVVWSTGDGLLLMSDAPFWQLVWTKVEYVGIVSVPLAWWATAVGYVGRRKVLTRRLIAYLAVIPFITLILTWSLESHTLIYRDYLFLRDQGILHLQITYGHWWWINAAYSYLFLIWGAGIFLLAASRSFYVFRSQAIVLLVGISLPLLGNLLHIFRIGPFEGLDPTPFTFTLAGLPLGWAIFRLRLFDLAPIARHAVMEGLQEGVVVLDRMNRVADLNPAAETILGLPGRRVVGGTVTEVLGIWLGPPGEVPEEDRIRQDLIRRVEGEERVYELTASLLSARAGDYAGRLILLRDVTAWKALGEELESARDEIRTLSELLPICAWCKQVRNDEGYWLELETYLTRQKGAQFTHSICPTCKARVIGKQAGATERGEPGTEE